MDVSRLHLGLNPFRILGDRDRDVGERLVLVGVFGAQELDLARSRDDHETTVFGVAGIDGDPRVEARLGMGLQKQIVLMEGLTGSVSTCRVKTSQISSISAVERAAVAESAQMADGHVEMVKVRAATTRHRPSPTQLTGERRLLSPEKLT